MSLFSTLNVGGSGLGVASAGLGVSGDNIANIGTTGFKHGRATFADFMPQDTFGLAGQNQLGSGAAVNKIATMFGQGTLEDSDSSLDMAVSGGGFFVVNDGSQSYYTRNGEMYLDDSGYVTTAQGLRLQGYNATDGELSPIVTDLQLATPTIPGITTTEVTLEAILSAETEVGTDLAAIDMFGTGTGTNTLTEAGAAADFSTSVTVYDSLGVGHEVSVLWERSASDEWTWRAVADASEVYDSAAAQFSTDEGYAFEIATGTATFDTDGNISAFTQTDTSAATAWTFQGAASGDYVFDFGMDSTGVASDGAVTMNGDESSVSTIAQDGQSMGALSGLSVGTDGTITGSYTNGEDVTIGQVVLASFKAEAGLTKVGSTLFSATDAAGEPAIGAAGTGGRGTIAGNALERSNVELEDEFVTMIAYQRSYQANAKVVTAADESLQTLVQLL